MILLSGSLELPFASTWHLVLVSFVGYCFGEIMCIWDSNVYQKGVLCFLIHKSYVRSIKRYCFVRMYAAIPVQLEIFYSPVQWQVCTCNMDFYRQSIRLLLSVELIDDKSLLLLLLLLLLLSTLPTSQIIKCRTTD